eukprot:Sdes_comp22076_c0_seq1m20601
MACVGTFRRRLPFKYFSRACFPQRVANQKISRFPNHFRYICSQTQPPGPIEDKPSVIRSKHPDVDIPSGSPSHMIIRKFPEYGSRAAFLYGKETITFSELYLQIHQMGNSLRNLLKVRPRDVVAIMLPNVPQFAVAWYAASMVGCIITTINPSFVAREVALQISDSHPKVIFVNSQSVPVVVKALETLNLSNVRLIRVPDVHAPSPVDASIFEYPELLQGQPTECEYEPVADDDVLALLYSSGTTGLPKGVMLTNRNITANLFQIVDFDHYRNQSNPVVMGCLPFYHVFGLVAILLHTHHHGVPISLLPKFDFSTFLSNIQNHHVTKAHIVPPIAVLLSKDPLVDKFDISTMTTLCCGAAPLGGEVQEQIMKRYPYIEIQQAYGMTELSPAALMNPPGQGKNGSVGILIPNTEAKILSVETGDPVKVGQPGVLHIRGPQVMKGYLNRMEATREMLDESSGFLNTGDLARMDADGYFYILERVKELIKYKGFQIAPAELEALLLEHPHIVDVAILPRPHATAGEVPVAFVKSRPGVAITEQDIHAFVDGKVSSHKQLRGGVVFIDEIPKSPSGKILRRLLKDRIPKHIVK